MPLPEKCGREGHCGLVTMCAYCEIECRKERDNLRTDSAKLMNERNGLLLQNGEWQARYEALAYRLEAGNHQNDGMRIILEQVAGDYHLKRMGMGKADLETCQSEPCAKIRKALDKRICEACNPPGGTLARCDRPACGCACHHG